MNTYESIIDNFENKREDTVIQAIIIWISNASDHKKYTSNLLKEKGLNIIPLIIRSYIRKDIYPHFFPEICKQEFWIKGILACLSSMNPIPLELIQEIIERNSTICLKSFTVEEKIYIEKNFLFYLQSLIKDKKIEKIKLFLQRYFTTINIPQNIKEDMKNNFGKKYYLFSIYWGETQSLGMKEKIWKKITSILS